MLNFVCWSDYVSLVLLLAAVICYLLYFVVWAPLAQKQSDMTECNVTAAETLQRVDSMASEILRLRDSGGAVNKKRNLKGLRFLFVTSSRS